MITEIADYGDAKRDAVLFDAGCGLCARTVVRFGDVLERRGFRLLPLQSDEAAALAGASRDELMTQMHVVTRDGRTLRGVDGVRVPIMRRGMEALYRVIARNRYRLSCSVEATRAAKHRRVDPDLERELRWAPALLPVAFVATLCRDLPAWAYRWSLAISIYFGC